MGDKELRDRIEALLLEAQKSPVRLRTMANRIAREVKSGA